MGLLSPADTHQVIHVKGSGVPHPIAHFPSKAKELAAGLCAQDPRRSRGVHWLGFPRAAFPGRGTAARNRRMLGAPPPPARAFRLLALGQHPAWTQLLAFLGCASPARTQIPAGTSLPSPGKYQGQIRSRPRVCRSAGPRQSRVGARREREARGGKGRLAGASCGGRVHPAPPAHRAPAPPPHSAQGLAIRPLYISGSRSGAGRGRRNAGRGGERSRTASWEM